MYEKSNCRFWRRAEDDFPKSGCLEESRCHHPSIQVLASSLKDEDWESSLEDSKILIVMSLENFDGFSLPNPGIHRSWLDSMDDVSIHAWGMRWNPGFPIFIIIEEWISESFVWKIDGRNDDRLRFPSILGKVCQSSSDGWSTSSILDGFLKVWIKDGSVEPGVADDHLDHLWRFGWKTGRNLGILHPSSSSFLEWCHLSNFLSSLFQKFGFQNRESDGKWKMGGGGRRSRLLIISHRFISWMIDFREESSWNPWKVIIQPGLTKRFPAGLNDPSIFINKILWRIRRKRLVWKAKQNFGSISLLGWHH